MAISLQNLIASSSIVSLRVEVRAQGMPSVNKKSVTIMNMRKEKVGLINAHGVLGSATKQPDGKWWYSYADIPEVGKYASYMQQVEECKAALSQTNIGAA